MTENEILEETPVEETVEDPAEAPVEDPVEGPVEETPVEDPTEEPVEETPVEDPAEGEEVTENDETEQQAAAPSSAETLVEDEEITTEVIPEPSTFTVTSPVVLALAEYDDVPTVMADVVSAVLGDYERLTYTTEEYDSSGNLISVSTEYVPGLAGLDYAWITGAILFSLLIAGVLKLLGGLIRS